MRQLAEDIKEKFMMNLRAYTTAGFDRGVPRWKEFLWMLLRSTLFLTAFPFPSGIKVAVLRWFGAKIGRRVVIRSLVNISFPWRLEIGDDVWIGDGVWILSLAKVCLESNVCISQRSYLCTGSHDYRRETFNLITKPIRIKEQSWVAAGAFVGPGVEVGPRSVVSAGSVVRDRVEPDTIVGGNPAQVLKEIARSA
jgi:putative colanic acid biosynthesis acetyltransferase WcaF